MPRRFSQRGAEMHTPKDLHCDTKVFLGHMAQVQTCDYTTPFMVLSVACVK